MTTRIGINGFGRMGRLVVRALRHHPELHLVHINEIKGDAAMAAHLLEFDTVHGRYDGTVATDGTSLTIDGAAVSVSAHAAPGDVPWDEHGVDLVIESSGKFRTVALLEPYFDRGVRKVVVAAPVKDADVLNVVMGCNDHLYEPTLHRIVTAASCTTNCLAPVVKVLHESIGIERGAITTIHDVTNTQVIVDAPHKDLRRARSALNSLIPTSTGSATAITMIYPELTGKLNGLAVRVPLLNASLTDAVFTMPRDVTVGRDQRSAAHRSRHGAEGHPRLRGPAAGVGGLHQRHPLGNRRRTVHHGRRRPHGQGARLVRQRVRLRAPDGRARGDGRHLARQWSVR